MYLKFLICLPTPINTKPLGGRTMKLKWPCQLSVKKGWRSKKGRRGGRFAGGPGKNCTVSSSPAGENRLFLSVVEERWALLELGSLGVYCCIGAAPGRIYYTKTVLQAWKHKQGLSQLYFVNIKLWWDKAQYRCIWESTCLRMLHTKRHKGEMLQTCSLFRTTSRF